MSNLLTNGCRSLRRTKLRLLAVVSMACWCLLASPSAAIRTTSKECMVSPGDDEEGANLADLWIDNRSASWSQTR